MLGEKCTFVSHWSFSMIKRHFPNILTLFNLLCGLSAILFLASGEVVWASYMVMLASLFDLLDGLTARLLKVSSPLGIQLDSLADLISFGVVPGLMVYFLLNGQLALPVNNGFALAGGFLPLFAAIRLAKFNLGEGQEAAFFSGVPVPLMAWFFVSIPLIMEEYGAPWLAHPSVLVATSLLFSFLMVSKVPIMSLKFKTLRLKENGFRWGVVAIAVLLVPFLHFAAVPIVIFLTFFSIFFVKKR
ncbi:MAG: CDP-diacylglycerol--serine O-phosphatidyltransferase [Bacteroidetes bacterium]|nr:MAG: CDP-diacylglycerol--serine O-phosphatidyltransferase [Bacteroidota bacterium]PIE87642.1 MAG: CDP-diacylglycerol--serine O-phosphatidyltransferase [Bacteroidota bacterium]